MVVVGLTELLPSAGRPAPPLIDTLVASVVVQLNVADPPAVIEVGAAEKPSTVGGAGLTVMVTFAEDAPPGPMAVRI